MGTSLTVSQAEKDQMSKKLMLVIKQLESLHPRPQQTIQTLDVLAQILPHAIDTPIPTKLTRLINTLVAESPPEAQLALTVDSLNQYAQDYITAINQSLLKQNVWETPDPHWQAILRNPTEYKLKALGAKNAGKRTGLYRFDKKTVLIKQGANSGETIAEFVGSGLYQLTLPNNAARCLLVKDTSNSTTTLEDIYVGSIYAKAGKIQDAYQAAGYQSRGHFNGIKARLKRFTGLEDSLIRQVVKINKQKANNSLSKCAASVLWHGDDDFHMGNFVLVDDCQFVKIDYGFSFFALDSQVVNIHNPFAGKVIGFHFRAGIKNPKHFVEFYPTNHFWDFAAESKLFYYNAEFINACDEIINLSPEQIQANIHQSLQTVTQVYGNLAPGALAQFADRIGMPKEEPSNATTIERYLTKRLIERQQSIADLSRECRRQLKNQDPARLKQSEQLSDEILKLLGGLLTVEKKCLEQTHSPALQQQKQTLEQQIDLLKLLEQANDLNILTVQDGALAIKQNFHYFNAGKFTPMTPDMFQSQLANFKSQGLAPPAWLVKFYSEPPIKGKHYHRK